MLLKKRKNIVVVAAVSVAAVVAVILLAVLMMFLRGKPSLPDAHEPRDSRTPKDPAAQKSSKAEVVPGSIPVLGSPEVPKTGSDESQVGAPLPISPSTGSTVLDGAPETVPTEVPGQPSDPGSGAADAGMVPEGAPETVPTEVPNQPSGTGSGDSSSDTDSSDSSSDSDSEESSSDSEEVDVMGSSSPRVLHVSPLPKEYTGADVDKADLNENALNQMKLRSEEIVDKLSLNYEQMSVDDEMDVVAAHQAHQQFVTAAENNETLLGAISSYYKACQKYRAAKREHDLSGDIYDPDNGDEPDDNSMAIAKQELRQAKLNVLIANDRVEQLL